MLTSKDTVGQQQQARQNGVIPTSIWSGFHKKALRERQNQLRLVYPALFNSSLGIINKNGTTHVSAKQPKSPTSLSSLTPNDSTASLAGLAIESIEESPVFPVTGLDEKVADNMIENCIGTMGLPVGLALNFIINGAPTVIPMVVEEPSVVAAVSGAAKTISSSAGGFLASTSTRNIIFAQVLLLDVADIPSSVATIESRKAVLIDVANSFVPNMVARGGGVVDISVRVPTRKVERPRKVNEVRISASPFDGASSSSWLVVHLHLDVCDAMGANAASTVAEGVAPVLAEWVRGRVGLRIVSNLCVERLAKSSFKIPIAKLAYKSFTGRQVAARIIEAAEWAQDDPFRAATHNKGIMNGIDAVAVATGQDWRAIEASAHAWAAGCAQSADTPQYRPLTHYWVESNDGVLDETSDDGLYFCGEMEMPISVGTKGGVLKTNPVYKYTLGMMGNPDSKTLAMAMISVGLAQNFAALRALTTEGIQKGHMSLHARNIAIAAGAPAHAINECVAYMVESNRVNQSVAREYLVAHEIHSTLINQETLNTDPTKHPPRAPSTFYIEIANQPSQQQQQQITEPITLNVAFETLGHKPVHLSLSALSPPSDLYTQLFQARFDYTWISSTFSVLDKIELSTVPEFPARSNRGLVKKLKVLSVLINMLGRSMNAQWPGETRRLVDKIVKRATVRGRVDAGFEKRVGITNVLPPLPLVGDARGKTVSSTAAATTTRGFDALQVGRPLLLALWQVFELRVLQWVGHELLAQTLLETQLEVLKALTEVDTLYRSGHRSSPLANQVTAAAASTANIQSDDTTLSSSEDDTDDEPLTIGKKDAVATAVQPPEDADEVIKDLHIIIHKQSRRFQTALFLLCDASSHDPNLLTPPRLRLLKSLGDLMAWEQMCAHDISKSRLARDIAALVYSSSSSVASDDNGTLLELEYAIKDGNAFLYWLTRTIGQESINKILAAALASLGSTDATTIRVAAWLHNNDGEYSETSEISRNNVLAAVLQLDLHTVFKTEIAGFLSVSSKEGALVKTIQEEAALEIFNKDTLLGITRLYRGYYGVDEFFLK
ncbi:hypothetical protein HK100_004726 [Physocladia obscura]|uniref:3-hydroxy-3-methylglutaryl coenzyme A reductase n=1 Tax=Physocladia obscura TaxID=109957 RepID=A0AAD5T6V5_9FUNG|nr:hypothetical protein HK100_004726 [Physocladia obscura]